MCSKLNDGNTKICICKFASLCQQQHKMEAENAAFLIIIRTKMFEQLAQQKIRKNANQNATK
jgi:hypothetical protein